MDASILYNTRWRVARRAALQRDDGRCTVSRLLGGDCSRGPLHVHHLVRPEDGGAPYDLDNLGTTCARHHPMWEKLRRELKRYLAGEQPRAGRPSCPHRHRTAEARALCESRLAREHARELSAA